MGCFRWSGGVRKDSPLTPTLSLGGEGEKSKNPLPSVGEGGARDGGRLRDAPPPRAFSDEVDTGSSQKML
jgi:hypothetical protein